MKQKFKEIFLRLRKKNEKFLSKKPLRFIFWIALPLLSYFAASYFAAVTIRLLLVLVFWNNDVGYQNAISNVITTTIYSTLFFSLMLAMVYFIPVKLFGQKISKDEIALKGLITWQDFGLAVFGFLISMVIADVLLEILPSILNFDKSQVQELAFQRGGMIHSWQFLLAFISIVVVTPFFEELIFRGIIYGQLPLAIFVTSLLFGIVHFQTNVGITVFVMSIIMCSIREKWTQTIWSGIVIHMIKNGIAFFLLYVLQTIQLFQS